MDRETKKAKVTAEFVRDNLAYEPETGVFLWKKRGPGRTLGRVLGSRAWNGYLHMKVDGTVYLAHRLAWLHVHGEWPAGSIDHIDGDRGNNAISNLRVATAAQNAARRPTTRKLAPSRGVFPHGPGFVARLHHGGKRHYLGYFATAAAAKAAYEAKAQEIHGEFRHVEHATRKFPPGANPNRDWLIVPSNGLGL